MFVCPTATNAGRKNNPQAAHARGWDNRRREQLPDGNDGPRETRKKHYVAHISTAPRRAPYSNSGHQETQKRDWHRVSAENYKIPKPSEVWKHTTRKFLVHLVWIRPQRARGDANILVAPVILRSDSISLLRRLKSEGLSVQGRPAFVDHLHTKNLSHSSMF
jgi:hypothetical protein